MTDNQIEINVFVAYSQEDKAFRDELAIHLKILKRQGFINDWFERGIAPGKKWGKGIAKELEKADLILMVISPGFLKSDYSNSIEVKKARELQKSGKADFIPIILKKCDWEKTSFYELTPLPESGKPVIGSHWYSMDEAFVNIDKALKGFIKRRKKTKEKENLQRAIELNGRTKIQVPGGPLHPDAVNYIERTADRQLEGLLEYASAPMFLIIGGVQSGKTSLVYQFLNKARKKREYKVIHIDFSELLAISRNPNLKDVFVFILKKTSEDLIGQKQDDSALKDEYEESIAVEWATEKLRKILEDHSDDKRTFLIIDSIDLLHDRVENSDKMELLIQWLAVLRNYQDSFPFSELTIIAVMTILSYSSTIISPLKTQAANISLPNFGKTEIKKLMEFMCLKMDIDENAAQIYKLFGGHPHLSHLAIYELCSGIGLPEIKAKAKNLIEGYRDYWERIKVILNFILHKRGCENPILSIFKALLSENENKTDYKIISDLFEELYLLGILEMNHQISSEFIKNAIKKEMEINEAV
jgi:GTPase SAR1 family protein